MRPKLRVWIAFGDELKFGDGRASLLGLIDERGSLRQAAAELGMSYRNAWGYLSDLEDAAGFKLLERVPGGGPRSGMRLTAEGKALVVRYARFRRGLEAVAERQFAKAFGKSPARRPGRVRPRERAAPPSRRPRRARRRR